MSEFGRPGSRPGGGPARGRNGPPPGTIEHDKAPVRRLSGAFSVVALVIWSLLVWGGYMLGDAVLTWLTANQATMMATGKDAGGLLGMGKEVGVAVNAFEATGIVSQVLALLSFLLLPVAVVVWLIGAVLALAAPLLIGRLAGILGRMRS